MMNPTRTLHRLPDAHPAHLMTPDDYLASNDPRFFLRGLFHKADFNDRKVRLIAVAGCRYVWELLTDERSRTAVEVAERFADGKATMRELEDANTAASEVVRYDSERYLVSYGPTIPPAFAARDAAEESAFWAGKAATDNLYHTGRAAYPTAGNVYHETPYNATELEKMRCYLMDVLRDISGYPFCPMTIDPAILAWHDGIIPRIAQSIYEERRMPEGTFDTSRMAMLHDALLDADCSDEAILSHCRNSEVHVRGCWTVDLILSKDR